MRDETEVTYSLDVSPDKMRYSMDVVSGEPATYFEFLLCMLSYVEDELKRLDGKVQPEFHL